MHIRLHIGAHKTATTHLQDFLEPHQEYLAGAGITYISRRKFRSSRIRRQVEAAYLDTTSNIFPKKNLKTLFAENGYDSNRILISDEDIIGSSFNLIRAMYPNHRLRLFPWRALLDEGKIEFYLSIRNYRDLLPSAYSQALRDGDIIPDFDIFRNHWLQAEPSWYKLLLSLRKLLPDSKITVWSFERYIQHPEIILKEFTGLSFTNVMRNTPAETRRLSVEALDAVRKLDPALPKAERRRLIAQLAKTFAGSPFDPLSDNEKNILSERYRLDCEKIQSLGMKTIF